MRISKIKNNFNRAATSYDQAATPQKKAAQNLAAQLVQHAPDFQPSSVLDLGCGTGFMTSALLNLYPKANYILQDLAESMLSQCLTKFKPPQFSYLQGDMDQIDFPSVDLIVSNFSLQWSCHIETCLHRLFQATKILAFNCLVEGSLKEWQERFPDQILMHYPKLHEFRHFILGLDPKAILFTQEIEVYSSSPKAFIQQLQQIGANTPVEQTSRTHLKQILRSPTPIQTRYQLLFAILEHH